jgi:hypothetical protein
VRGEEGEHVVEEVVGEGADMVASAARHGRPLRVAPLRRRYVEQVAGVGKSAAGFAGS